MRITVASGKGGVGKTLATASLARVWDAPLTAIDLDVEAPNLHLFLHPELDHWETAGIEVPEADESRCTHCRACAEICQFKAITVLGSILLIFPEMCHGCGGCLAICPEKVLSPGTRELGRVSRGLAGPVRFVTGRLRVGEAMSPPLIRAVVRESERLQAERPTDVLADAPPGVSCPAVNAVSGSDALLLVTEPTPFGLHDLELAVEAFTPLGMPMGLMVNRAGIGDDRVQVFAEKAGLPILAELPYDRRVAQAYSQGLVLTDAVPEYRPVFEDLRDRLREMARRKEKVNRAH